METAIVILIVLAAVVFLGLRIKSTLSGHRKGCAGCRLCPRGINIQCQNLNNKEKGGNGQ